MSFFRSLSILLYGFLRKCIAVAGKSGSVAADSVGICCGGSLCLIEIVSEVQRSGVDLVR